MSQHSFRDYCDLGPMCYKLHPFAPLKKMAKLSPPRRENLNIQLRFRHNEARSEESIKTDAAQSSAASAAQTMVRVRAGVHVGRLQLLCGRRLVVGSHGVPTLAAGLSILLLTPLALALAVSLPSLLARATAQQSSVIAHAAALSVSAVLTTALLLTTATADPGVLLIASDAAAAESASRVAASVAGDGDETGDGENNLGSALQQLAQSAGYSSTADENEILQQRLLCVEIDGKVFTREFCAYCGIWRPLRASHCAQCGVCVREFDHHCPYLATCIGVRNRTLFVLFAIAAASAALLLCSFALRDVLTASDKGDGGGSAVSIVLAVYGAAFGAALAALAATHIAMASFLDVTTDNFHAVVIHRMPRNYPAREQCFVPLSLARWPSELTENALESALLKREHPTLPPDIVFNKRVPFQSRG